MLGLEGVRHPRKLRLEARNRQGAACSRKERNAGARCKNDALQVRAFNGAVFRFMKRQARA